MQRPVDEQDEDVSYEMLQELVRAERRSNKLMPVPARFWPEVRGFLASVTQEFHAAQQKDPWSRKAMLLSDEVKNAKHAAENLWALRERKMAMLALARERDRKRPEVLTADEAQLFDALLGTLDKFRATVFEGTVAAPTHQGTPPGTQPTPRPPAPAPAPRDQDAPAPAAPETAPPPPPAEPPPPAVVPADTPDQESVVTIRALGDIPPFVGPDMQTYLLKEGDLATVPPSIAKLLVKRGKAAVLDEG